MQIDTPLVRADSLCPLCAGAKPVGIVACWRYYRATNLKYGNATAEARIMRREVFLARGNV